VKKEDRPPGATAHGYYCLWSGEQVVVEYQTLVGTTFPPGTQPEQAAATDTPSDLRYVHWDLLSVRLVTDGNGNQVDTQSHTAYGGEMDEGEDEALPFFTTYKRDLTELDYARARYYRSNHRRFTSPDSYRGSYRSGSPQSLNRYAYVANDPVNRTDPTGLSYGPPPKKDKYPWGGLPINDPGPPPRPPVNPPPSPCIADENGECPPPSGGNVDPLQQVHDCAQKNLSDARASRITDCEALARVVECAARIFGGNVPAFINALQVVLTDTMGRLADPNTTGYYIPGFGNTGFRPQFQDDELQRQDPNAPPPNQVRHFIGWLVAGYYWQVFAIPLLYQAESGPGGTQDDIDLGLAAIFAGAAMSNPIDRVMRPEQLGQWIRDNICQR
jgi:RHS repeat-associated protein